MILWAFINQFLIGQSEWLAQVAGMFIGTVLLWDVLFRAQLGVSVVFFEEMYSRNLGHLFVSPLRPVELISSLLLISMMRTLIGVGTAAVLAIILYHYSIFDMGLPLLVFFFNLMVTGWSIGILVMALVLRYGLGAESLAWAVTFAIAPLAAVYYPVSVLPSWLQPVAMAIPASHVFEGMRALLIEHQFRVDLLLNAVLLNILYMAVAMVVFLLSFHIARKHNLLLHIGE